MKNQPVKLAIVGSGGMANLHASQFQENKHCRLVAAVDIDPERARTFATKHGIPEAYGDLKEMLATVDCDAVSIVAPDAFHTPLTLQCLKAGKHVLCEKPLALNFRDAQRMVTAARKAGVVAMVNLSYRDWPAIQAVAALVHKGALGEIRHVEASYLQAWLASKIWGDWRSTPAWLWRLSTTHGSRGVLGDVGVHIVDFASFPVGPIASVFCRLKTFPKAPKNRIGEYVLDANDSAVINVEFANGALGVIHTTRWCAGHANRLHLKISGTKGSVEIDSDRSTTGYRICSGANLHKALWKEVEAKKTPSNYQRFIRAIRTGKPDLPDFHCGAEAQKVLDACLLSDARQRPVKVAR